jgi:hypothetical protein
MKIHVQSWLQLLSDQTHSIINATEALRLLSKEQLEWRPHAKAWHILECLEHLNRYGRFYIPKLTELISHQALNPKPTFNTSWLGQYFIKSMQPKAKLRMMKTFKSMDPIYASSNTQVIDEFLEQQQQILVLIQLAGRIDMNKAKCPTSISKLLRFNIGETLGFVIAHNARHLEQVNKLLNQFNKF